MHKRREFIKYLASIGVLGVSVWPKEGLSDAGIDSRNAYDASDVVIIGSGPAGLSVADCLSNAGMQVLIIETGTNKRTRSHQELSQVLPRDTPLPYDLSLASQRVVGGTTNVWGGVCPRFQSGDLTSASSYGYGFDWPLQYQELERHYCAAEHWLNVSSALCAQNNPSPYIKSAAKLSAYLKNQRHKNILPASMSVNEIGQQRPMRLGQYVMPKLLQRKNIRLLQNTTVRKIDVDNQGKAQGVYCVALAGREFYIKAKLVIVCGGVVQNARLLLLSKNQQFPQGLGNHSGHVGSWLMEHANMQYWLKPKQHWLSTPYDSAYVHIFDYYQKMKEQGLGSTLLRVGANSQVLAEGRRYANPQQTFVLEALCEQEPLAKNRVVLHTKKTDRFGDALPELSFTQTGRDKETIVQASKQLEGLLDKFGNDYTLRPLRLGSHHLMGTTRMSINENEGVVDKNLKVFGTSNVYIAGASVFSTGAAANPTLTLTALSLRLAAHIISLQKQGALKAS